MGKLKLIGLAPPPPPDPLPKQILYTLMPTTYSITFCYREFVLRIILTSIGNLHVARCISRQCSSDSSETPRRFDIIIW